MRAWAKGSSGALGARGPYNHARHSPRGSTLHAWYVTPRDVINYGHLAEARRRAENRREEANEEEEAGRQAGALADSHETPWHRAQVCDS